MMLVLRLNDPTRFGGWGFVLWILESDFYSLYLEGL